MTDFILFTYNFLGSFDSNSLMIFLHFPHFRNPPRLKNKSAIQPRSWMQNMIGLSLYMQVFLYTEVKLEQQKLHECFWLTLILVAFPSGSQKFHFSKYSITSGIKRTVLYASQYLNWYGMLNGIFCYHKEHKPSTYAKAQGMKGTHFQCKGID